MHEFAGQLNKRGFSGDGGLAVNAELDGPHEMALAPDGALYFADSRNNRIRRVTPAGIIETVAGNGESGDGGDGGPAAAAQFNIPTAIAVAPDGTLYIGDTINNKVRRVDAGGTITTYAGTGGPGYSGDDGPATEARLSQVRDLLLAPDGTLYLTTLRRVRAVAPDGTITTLVNRYGLIGSSGDGGPAIDASLRSPDGLALDQEGNIFVADSDAHLVRRIAAAAGTISTVAGSSHYAGDGGPATEASLFLSA